VLTYLPSLAGGMRIGLSSAMLLVLNGRIAGMLTPNRSATDAALPLAANTRCRRSCE
jgi:hypothetical protein